MTEAEWLAAAAPSPMPAPPRARGGMSERKLRLFAVACCRRVWHLFPHDNYRRAVDAAEQFAEGSISWGELDVPRRAAGSVYDERGPPTVRVATIAGYVEADTLLLVQAVFRLLEDEPTRALDQ